jgi:hypothetical protein
MDIPAPNVTLIPVQLGIPSLHETLGDYFPVGAAIMSDQLYDSEHAYLLTRHFNSITPENEMKPISIQPSEGNFTWRGWPVLRFPWKHFVCYAIPGWLHKALIFM